jgi:chromosome partitioning protein
VKVITLAAQKGGCGKSALAISCAALAAQRSRVLVLDLDPQGTARQWESGRNGAAPEVRSVRTAAELESALTGLPSDYDFVFIDTPGRDEPGEAAAIRAADLTLIPCRPTMADVRAMPATAAVAQRLNRRYAFILTQVGARSGTRADETAAALAEVGEVAPIRIGQRIAWQDSYAASLGVSEYEPNGTAARELAALWRWLNARLKGLKHG